MPAGVETDVDQQGQRAAEAEFKTGEDPWHLTAEEGGRHHDKGAFDQSRIDKPHDIQSHQFDDRQRKTYPQQGPAEARFRRRLPIDRASSADWVSPSLYAILSMTALKVGLGRMALFAMASSGR